MGPQTRWGWSLLLLACFSDNPGVVCRQDALRAQFAVKVSVVRGAGIKGTLWGKVGQGCGSAPLRHTAQ